MRRIRTLERARACACGAYPGDTSGSGEKRRVVEFALVGNDVRVRARPQPLGGAELTRDQEVSLRVPDRPSDHVSTQWHLTYEEERDALTVAREAARAVESLVDGLIEAFEKERRAIEQERERDLDAT